MRTLLLVAILIMCSPASAQSLSEESELRELLPYLEDLELVPPEIARSSCSARLIGYALLYRHYPVKYRNAFFDELVIDDYADRVKGKYNYVEPDEIAAIIDNAASAPDGVENRSVSAAVGFCALKSKNLWVGTRDAGNISIARVVRGVALSTLLEGTDEDPLTIANAIDAFTASGKRQSGS